jgi:catechol 2,3-dioxygenase-like lactoylglutathione lyase family enzyme
VQQPFSRIDHIQLAMPAGEEHRARDFYAGMLGMQELPKPPELAARGGAWFRSGRVNIHLGVDPDFHPAKKAHPAFQCTNYDALVASLREHGATIVPDEHLFDGSAHCYISDPFGNRIELIADNADAKR